jgi:uracil-DNA glycosylase
MNRPEPPASWADLPFFAQPVANGQTAWDNLWTRLKDETAADRLWQPAPDAIFRALELTPRDHVRAVIIGQDPYPRPGSATGLAFSLPSNMAPRHSLRKILDAIKRDTGRDLFSGDLTHWAKSGILLLNTALTVQINRPGSHMQLGWDQLCNDILRACASDGGKVFFAFGQIAQTVCNRVNIDTAHNLVVRTSHPMARRNATDYFGTEQPFLKANRWLSANNRRHITWDLS